MHTLLPSREATLKARHGSKRVNVGSSSGPEVRTSPWAAWMSHLPIHRDSNVVTQGPWNFQAPVSADGFALHY